MKRARKAWLASSVAAALCAALIITLTLANGEAADPPLAKRVCRHIIPAKDIQHLLPNGSSLSEESQGFPKAPLSHCQLAGDDQSVSATIKRSGPFPSKREVLKEEQYPISFGGDYGYFVRTSGVLRLLIPCDALPRSRSMLPLLIRADRMKHKNIASEGRLPRAFLRFAGETARAVAQEMECTGWQNISKQPPKPVQHGET